MRSNVDGPGREDRRRRPLRGLCALALPPLGPEEPETLDLRRRLPARLQRGRGRQRPLADADPVFGGRRKTHRRSKGAIPPRRRATGREERRSRGSGRRGRVSNPPVPGSRGRAGGTPGVRRRLTGWRGTLPRVGGGRRAGGWRVGPRACRSEDAVALSDLGSRRDRGGAAGGRRRSSSRDAGAELALPGRDGGGRSRTCARRSVQTHGEGYEHRAVERPEQGGDALANARLDAYHLEGGERRVRLAHGSAGGTEAPRPRVREREDVACAGGRGRR